jgi:acyl-CoA synthetase (AMP-forming)/AMP-acid ligase II
MEFNIADLFECVADTVPDREAMVSGSTRLRYRELDDRTTRLAHALADLGVGVGDHVGLYLGNTSEHVEAMLAAYKLRAVPFNINYRYGREELAQVAKDGDAVLLVVDEHLRGNAEGLGLPLVNPGLQFEELVARGSPDRDFGPRSGDDHYILYTGGTTGAPKGVVWRHEDIFFATLGGGNPGGDPIERPEQVAETVLVNRAHRAAPFLPPGDPGPDEFVTMSLGPLMHASGQWMALGTLVAGGKVVLYTEPHMDMERVLDLVQQERVAMLSMVGDATARPMVELLESDPGRWDTSALLLVGSGGALLSGDVKDRLLAAIPSLLAITEAVGSSEAPVMASSLIQRGAPPSQSLKFAPKMDGGTMVVDDDLRPVEPGSRTIGRLAARGRSPIGYWKDPAKTAATFVQINGERWSLPGDMATVEADGSIRLLGRGAMCINTGGEKVYPEEVESALKAHPAVADAIVVGEPDERWGQRVVAVVQLRDPAQVPSLETLQEHCRATLAGYKIPRRLELVDEVRRSPAGKPDYRWAADLVTSRTT